MVGGLNIGILRYCHFMFMIKTACNPFPSFLSRENTFCLERSTLDIKLGRERREELRPDETVYEGEEPGIIFFFIPGRPTDLKWKGGLQALNINMIL